MNSYQMVLHRPVETAGDFGKLQIGGVTPGTIAVLLSHMVHNL
jgi:hypothetical protein